MYRGQSSGNLSQIDSVGSGTSTYTDTGLSTGTQYFYAVSAYNSAGESNLSNEDSATTHPALKVYDGSSFSEHPVYVWTGETWEHVSDISTM